MVKAKDTYHSQDFSVKNQKPPTLMINKECTQDEAMAGIALLNKHDEAMKRYQGGKITQSDYYAKNNIKPQWNKATIRSPSAGNPYVPLLSEPDGYQFIQLKQTSFASNIPED